MSRKRYCIQVTFNRKERSCDDIPSLLECLRYAGLIRQEPPEQVTDSFNEFNSVWRETIYIYPPKPVVDEKLWAESNASRIKTFGLKAEAKEVQ